jgi:hypothetical protein
VCEQVAFSVTTVQSPRQQNPTHSVYRIIIDVVCVVSTKCCIYVYVCVYVCVNFGVGWCQWERFRAFIVCVCTYTVGETVTSSVCSHKRCDWQCTHYGSYCEKKSPSVIQSSLVYHSIVPHLVDVHTDASMCMWMIAGSCTASCVCYWIDC